MRHHRVAAAIALALALAGAPALVWVGVAVAAPAPPAAQARADATAGWLGRTLHQDIPPRAVIVAAAEDMSAACGARCTAYVPFTDPTTIITSRPVASGWARLATDWRAVALGHVLVHELLHRRDLNTAAYGDGWVEEGVTDAVTVDVMPAWCRWALDAACPAVRPVYRARVAAIRAASARATGSTTWRTRAARIWRRQLLAADTAARRLMLEAVS